MLVNYTTPDIINSKGMHLQLTSHDKYRNTEKFKTGDSVSDGEVCV